MSDPLRICYVLSHFHPRESGAERQALAQGRELARRGHQVQVVTRAIADLPSDETVDGVTIHRWVETSQRGPLFAISFVAGVVRAPAAAPAVLRPDPHPSGALGVDRLRGGAAVSPRGTDPDPAGELGLLRRGRGDGADQGIPLAPSRDRSTTRPSRPSPRTSSGNGSGWACRRRRWSGWPAASTPSGFVPARARVERDLPPRPRVVFTGRLHPQKNLDLLLDAWTDVGPRTGATLILVGDGPERERLGRPGLGARRSPTRVHFAGPID